MEDIVCFLIKRKKRMINYTGLKKIIIKINKYYN